MHLFTSARTVKPIVHDLKLSLDDSTWLQQLSAYQPEVIMAEHASENQYVLEQAVQQWAAYGLYYPKPETIDIQRLVQRYPKVILLHETDHFAIAFFKQVGHVVFDPIQYAQEVRALLEHIPLTDDDDDWLLTKPVDLRNMLATPFIHELYPAKLDIIGDIHGEIDALDHLLASLGYDEYGYHTAGRKLVFVGDLCDRGLNSLAVMQRVKTMMECQNAQCVIGNHELNLLIDAKREGNGWFFGSPHEDDQKSFQSVAAKEDDRAWVLEFLNRLPLVLENQQLRIVHACWNTQALKMLKRMPANNIKDAYQYFVKQADVYVQASGIAALADQEQQAYAQQLKDALSEMPLLENIAKKDFIEQMHNPMKVLTSGAEAMIKKPFYVGGKWRMIDRLAWWDEYTDDIPVVMGHYWRNFKTTEEKTGLFKNIDALQWFGAQKNVFCIDYSVGKRYLDRNQQGEYTHQLCALRFPERLLHMENGTSYRTVE